MIVKDLQWYWVPKHTAVVHTDRTILQYIPHSSIDTYHHPSTMDSTLKSSSSSNLRGFVCFHRTTFFNSSPRSLFSHRLIFKTHFCNLSSILLKWDVYNSVYVVPFSRLLIKYWIVLLLFYPISVTMEELHFSRLHTTEMSLLRDWFTATQW